MLMKKFALAAGLMFAVCQMAFAAPSTGKYAIDAAHSSVTFSIDHLGYTKVSGRFNELEGQINVDGKKKSMIDVKIKAASIDTNHDKRDDHLRSPDFFNVKQFPTITFKSPLKMKKGKLHGELELIGVTKPVVLALVEGKEGKDPWGLYRVGYSASTTIKRSEFGMDFMLGGLADDIEVTINIEAVKQ